MASATVTGPPTPQWRPPRRTGGSGGGGTVGPPGPAGPGVPAGGSTGQVLEKASSMDYATVWADPPVSQGLSGVWNYKATGGLTDPGTGNIAPDVVGAPTLDRFSTFTVGGTDARNLFLTTQVGDVLVLQQKSDSTKWAKQQVRAPVVDHGTWFEVPITTLAGGTGGALANNADVVVDFNRAGTAAGAGGAVIGPTPPASPAVGSLWWRSDPDGRLFVWYDDGNSQQWVPATPTGVPALGYRHVQASAAATWSIAHGLSFRPNISAVDSTGQEIVPGAVSYPSDTTVQLTFSAAVGGEAYLS